jgi:hypothetical protein
MNKIVFTMSGKNSFCHFLLQVDDVKKPYGIALHDFPATHPDDLPFKVYVN